MNEPCSNEGVLSRTNEKCRIRISHVEHEQGMYIWTRDVSGEKVTCRMKESR